jgi:hypothetical protein
VTNWRKAGRIFINFFHGGNVHWSRERVVAGEKKAPVSFRHVRPFARLSACVTDFRGDFDITDFCEKSAETFRIWLKLVKMYGALDMGTKVRFINILRVKL